MLRAMGRRGRLRSVRQARQVYSPAGRQRSHRSLPPQRLPHGRVPALPCLLLNASDRFFTFFSPPTSSPSSCCTCRLVGSRAGGVHVRALCRRARRRCRRHRRHLLGAAQVRTWASTSACTSAAERALAAPGCFLGAMGLSGGLGELNGPWLAAGALGGDWGAWPQSREPLEVAQGAGQAFGNGGRRLAAASAAPAAALVSLQTPSAPCPLKCCQSVFTEVGGGRSCGPVRESVERY